MDTRPEWTKGRALPPTERELEMVSAQAMEEEELAFQEVQHYRTLGLALAALALSMWEGLEGSGLAREEKLTMINSALRGR